MDDFQGLVSKCDNLIKNGHMGEVAALVGAINLARMPRAYRQPLAKICRRAGLTEKGLRILYPVVRSLRAMDEPASGGEIAEYSVLLSRNGSIAEALDLLAVADSGPLPEVLLYRGFCYVSSWDYERAAVEFENYLRVARDEYSMLIARVNLASSYLASGRLELAMDRLNETIAQTEKAEASRLGGNLFELRGQVHVLNGDFAHARADLDRAARVFGDGQSYDQLLILKWRAVMEAGESGSIEPLLAFRAEAWRRRHWESVREADLFVLKQHFDQRRFDHLLIGTAAAPYRKRIRQILPQTPGIFYPLGDAESDFRLNLRTAELAGRGELNPGKKLHQAVAALTRDFYVPRNLGTLFSDLYPGEYFNAESSPSRVRQILRRVRRWFDACEIPAAVRASGGGYRLEILGPFAIDVPYQTPPMESHALRWADLEREFNTSFTIQAACARLDISRTSYHRLAQWAIHNGSLQVTGSGKATRYRVVKKIAA